MKLEVEKDRLEINKIIENVLPLMIKNKNLTQECADCIVLYFIEKCSHKTSNQNNNHQEKNGKSVVPKGSPIAKAEASTAKIAGDGGSLGDTAGCSGQANVADKEDTNNSVLPADLNSYKCGHKTNGMIVMDDNLLSMFAYIQWAEEEKNLETKKECFDCYLKKLK